MDWMQTIFGLLGGLGLFLFGMHMSSDSLKTLAGNKLKLIIEKSTNTPLKGILVGFVLTTLIQSSSGTTALTVGLVSAGLMTLTQAVGVIMGANIGSTVTVFLIGLDIGEYALPVVFLGALFLVFAHKKKLHSIGGVIFGFGLIFYGLEVMGSGIKNLADQTYVQTFLLKISDVPILGLLVGTGLTALIQSSSATIGILQQFSAEAVGLRGAIAIVLGANIGTTITAILSSIGGSTEAKRTALFHALFNVIGAALFMIILVPYSNLIETISNSIHLTRSMTIAIAHISFNVISTFIIFWFTRHIVRFCEFAIKGQKESDAILEIKNAPLDSPSLSLEISKRTIEYMGDKVFEMYAKFIEYSSNNVMSIYEEAMVIEEEIDNLDKLVHNYLIQVSELDLLPDQSLTLAKYLDTIGDFERIGDHCTNLFEFVRERYDNNESMSTSGQKGFNHLADSINTMLKMTVEAFKEHDVEEALEVQRIEEEIDKLETKYRKEHVLRMYEGLCKVSLVDNYSDILSNLERIGDHCNNVAEKVSSGNTYFID